MSRCIYDFIQCVPASFDREVRATGGIIAPVAYEITGGDGSRDKPFIGEVTAIGPGCKDQHGNWEEVPVDVGDVVVCTVHNLSYRFTEQGKRQYLLRSGVAYATIKRIPAQESDDAIVSGILDGTPAEETYELTPIQDLILVRTGPTPSLLATATEPLTVEERALRHMRGNEGRVWLPTEDMATDDVRSPAIKAEYGEVIAVGPGRWRDGRWSEPPCKEGDLVLFDGSYSTLPIRIRGERYTLVPAPQLVKIAESAPDDDFDIQASSPFPFSERHGLT